METNTQEHVEQMNFKAKSRFFERMKNVLRRESSENASDFIRNAALREIERRERAGRK